MKKVIAVLMIFTALVSVYITANNRLNAEGFAVAIEMTNGASKAMTDTIQDLQLMSAITKYYALTTKQTFSLQYIEESGNRYNVTMESVALGIIGNGTTYIVAENIAITNETEALSILAMFNHDSIMPGIIGTIIPGTDVLPALFQYVVACTNFAGLLAGNIVRIATDYIGAWMYLMGF